MHTLFGEWYRKASIETSGEELTARWKGIESFVQKIDVSKIIELVRCFMRLPWRDVTVREEFQKVFHTLDPAFRMRDNEVELQVLAGATLVAILDQRDEISDIAAMVLNAAAAPGLRKAAVVPEILVITQKYIFDRSVAVRSVPSRDRVAGTKHQKLIESVKTACASNALDQLAQPLEKVLSTLNETINAVAQTAETALVCIEKAEKVQAEESNIIWWVFGETSRDMAKAFSKLPKSFASVLAGKELADLTHIVPGPRAARAYLDKVLDKFDTKKITLENIAHEVPEDWLSELHFEESVLDSCPILYTLHKAAEQREPKARATTLKPAGISGSGLTPLEVAVQMYHESLASKVLGRK